MPDDGRSILTSSHWGAYRVTTRDGRFHDVRPFEADGDPSLIGGAMADFMDTSTRVRRPAVRAGFLRKRGTARDTRGSEPFVEVDWDVALDIVAEEMRRIRDLHGNEAIFGGSYGWASAGRFHHAPGQLHRFLNTCGGYVRHVGSYSLGAARTLLPHIIDTLDNVLEMHTSWASLEQSCDLFVAFGGVPVKNAQVNAGGASRHLAKEALRRMTARGVGFVNVSPLRSDLSEVPDAQWLPVRPNTDTALMLALAQVLVARGLHDAAFLSRNCVGFAENRAYLLGESDGQPKDAPWAAAITGIPAATIEALALRMASSRTMINVSWSLQRADHGEQAFWAAVLLAAVLGQIGLPGGGIGFGYGCVNSIGADDGPRFSGPRLPQGHNPVTSFIPVARIADMLLRPGDTLEFNGRELRYPDIRMVHWAGGNVFHHHQDINKLVRAWRRPEMVVAHEQFWTAQAKFADVVLPATTTLERDDIGSASSDRLMIAMRQVVPPCAEARDDYAILADLADRLELRAAFTEQRSTMGWLRHLYDDSRGRALAQGVELPDFDEFWQRGSVEHAPPLRPAPPMLAAFRQDPAAAPLPTPSGRLELFSRTIAGFGYDDCPGHPTWMEPAEWLGGSTGRYDLHMLSNQPVTRLHSQLDHGRISRASKRDGREKLTMNLGDARDRGITEGDTVRVFNDRGAFLASAALCGDTRPGVIQIATGAWYNPVVLGEIGALDKHGNPNVVTRDVGTSRLTQGCVAQTAMVAVEPVREASPVPDPFEPARFLPAA
jgi:biotin/methionine sulfoxide reductase